MAAIVSGNDHELALEEALQRIGGEPGTDEEDEDDLSVVDYDDEQRPTSSVVSAAGGPAAAPESTGSNGDMAGGAGSGGGGRYEPYTPSNSVALKEVLGEYRSFMLFRRFLKDQCITRNLQFWLACEYYHTQMPLEGIKAAKAIYCRFLKSSAPLHVSILEATKRKICTIVQLGSPPGYTLFLEAQQEVYNQMEANELQQFLCSDSFSECTQFPHNSQNMYGSMTGDMGFQPSRYRNGGSLHSSDDSTSVTSFASEDVGSTHTQVLCLPHHTKSVYTPRNAHSDTEHSSSHSRRHHYSGPTTHFSRNKVLTQNQFYEIVCEKLSAVQRERAAMMQRARNIARIAGKSYEEIMAIEWFDTPEAIRYVRFDEEGSTGSNDALNSPPLSLPPVPPHQQHSVVKRTVDSTDTPPSTTSGTTSSHHLISFGLKEIQEAMRDLDIASQVRQKRSSAALMSSSASSYISDSGVGESNLPSSGSGGPVPGGHSARPPNNRVHMYLQNQQRVTSQQTERETQAQLVATMLMNNSVPSDELNPYHNNGRRSYANYPGAYSSDDSSSCFTATSHSSNSEFFVPRRPHPLYGDSNDETRQQSHHPRYPPSGMRRLPPSSRRPPSSRYLPQQATPTQPPQQQQAPTGSVPLSTSTRAISPSVHQTSKGGETLLVAYSWEGKTYANKLQVNCLSLGDFKEKMFKRKGQYRFFFKSFCEELNDVILEEISDDSVTLPLFEGKIVGQVEGISD